MKRLAILTLLSLLVLSCSNREENQSGNIDSAPVDTSSLIPVAKGIIYDVILIPKSEDDEWENERLQGYNGTQMMEEIFNAIYNRELEVFDYFTGEPLSVKDVKEMEKSEGFERSKIGKIQFTEDWYLNLDKLQIEKKIVSIVPGYESRTDDGAIITYKAAFQIVYSKESQGN